MTQVKLLTMDCSPFNGSFTSNSAPSSRLLHDTTTIVPLKCEPMKRKPNTNRTSVFKSSAIAPCTECGKQFNSWKALFGHMRCHPDRPWRGMNMKQKPKPKPKLHAQETSNWDHITDEVTRAALILMEMSGQSVGKIVDCLKKSCKEEEEEEVGKAAKEFAKVEKPLLDLNLAPPVEH
ncbi:Zinc finger protein ZAT2 [Carex littledalei]|uniref:Zinc finger protein ZAT2 n=1 Tax=Carex littledalei TaxID=544730 RepID=A0A833QG66_9POAL|nr:Zinc finger protein ZAT2 [Carex littledalei]